MALLCCCALSVHAQAPSAGSLGGFAGHWLCNGHFESNGAAIAGEISIETDERSGALVVHHDDVAPGAYHALKIWMPNKEGTGLRAAISDQYSGMRWFESPGWVGKTLTWTRWDHGTGHSAGAVVGGPRRRHETRGHADLPAPGCEPTDAVTGHRESASMGPRCRNCHLSS
jgi:hypothetical protein